MHLKKMHIFRLCNCRNSPCISVLSQPGVDGLCERVHPVGRSEVSASGSPVHLEHEDQHLHGWRGTPQRSWVDSILQWRFESSSGIRPITEHLNTRDWEISISWEFSPLSTPFSWEKYLQEPTKTSQRWPLTVVTKHLHLALKLHNTVM